MSDRCRNRNARGDGRRLCFTDELDLRVARGIRSTVPRSFFSATTATTAATATLSRRTLFAVSWRHNLCALNQGGTRKHGLWNGTLGCTITALLTGATIVAFGSCTGLSGFAILGTRLRLFRFLRLVSRVFCAASTLVLTAIATTFSVVAATIWPATTRLTIPLAATAAAVVTITTA